MTEDEYRASLTGITNTLDPFSKGISAASLLGAVPGPVLAANAVYGLATFPSKYARQEYVDQETYKKYSPPGTFYRTLTPEWMHFGEKDPNRIELPRPDTYDPDNPNLSPGEKAIIEMVTAAPARSEYRTAANSMEFPDNPPFSTPNYAPNAVTLSPLDAISNLADIGSGLLGSLGETQEPSNKDYAYAMETPGLLGTVANVGEVGDPNAVSGGFPGAAPGLSSPSQNNMSAKDFMAMIESARAFEEMQAMINAQNQTRDKTEQEANARSQAIANKETADAAAAFNAATGGGDPGAPGGVNAAWAPSSDAALWAAAQDSSGGGAGESTGIGGDDDWDY